MAVKKKVVEIDTQQATTSVKDLRTQLKALKDTMASTEAGTEEYNKALRQAAEIQHQLKEQMRLVNNSAADFGQIVSNTTSVLGGMIAGFQSANAVMNMFGVENEDVIKSLQKMQNLMALTQALPALDKAVKGFQNLRTVIQTATGATGKFGKALVSTGLGALVVALGYIVSHFEEISKWLDEVTGQTDFLGTVADAVVGGLNAAWAGLVQTIKAVGNAIVTYITTPFKSVWAAIQAYTSTEGGFVDKLKAAGKAMKNGFVSDWKDVGNDFKKIGEVSANAYQEGFNKNRAKRLAKNEEEAKEIGAARGKAKAEAEEAAYKKRLRDIDTQERDEMLKLQAMGLSYEEYVAKKQELEDEFTKKRIEALQNILDTETTLTEQEIASLKDELIKLQDSLYKKPEETKTASTEENLPPEALTAKQISEAINASALALNDFSDNPAWGNILKNVATLAANWDTLQTQIKEGGSKAFTAYAQIAATALSAVAQMMNGLAAEQDTTNKEGFEQAKKYQIAGATMSMLAGIASAWASSMQLMFPANVIIGSALSAMMLGTGIAQIAKIKNTQFNGGSTSGSSATPNTSAVASMQAPVQYTQDVQGANIEGAIKDTRVYVTEGDISSTQKKVDVAESEARF